jgi:hypothetical protein
MSDGDTLPSAHQIRAACRAASLLTAPRMLADDAARAYQSSPDGGRFSEQDLRDGEALLISAGMVSLAGAVLKVSPVAETLAQLDDETATLAVVTRLLERRPPLWLRGAAGGSEVSQALIPDDSRAELEGLLENHAHMEALLLSAARRADKVRLRGSAAIGRAFVEEACRRQLTEAGATTLAAGVRRVGDLTEALGYDLVAPTLAGTNRRLAVRTTRRAGWRAEVSLSRTEIEVGLADPAWALVVCELKDDTTVHIAGWCRAAELTGLIPADQHPHGRWVQASLLLMQAVLEPDLPPL